MTQNPSILQFILKFINSFEKKPALQDKIVFVIQNDRSRRGQIGAIKLVIKAEAQIVHKQLKSRQAARLRLQMFMRC